MSGLHLQSIAHPFVAPCAWSINAWKPFPGQPLNLEASVEFYLGASTTSLERALRKSLGAVLVAAIYVILSAGYRENYNTSAVKVHRRC